MRGQTHSTSRQEAWLGPSKVRLSIRFSHRGGLVESSGEGTVGPLGLRMARESLAQCSSGSRHRPGRPWLSAGSTAVARHRELSEMEPRRR